MYKAGNINKEFNLENAKQYKNKKIELKTEKETKQYHVEDLYIDMIEGTTFIVKIDGDYWVGSSECGEEIYLIEDDFKILLN